MLFSASEPLCLAAGAWNNLGNPNAALGNWEVGALLSTWCLPLKMAFCHPACCMRLLPCPAQVAEQCFSKAASLAPEFAFASGNQALALFQLGETDRAVRQMRWAPSVESQGLTNWVQATSTLHGRHINATQCNTGDVLVVTAMLESPHIHRQLLRRYQDFDDMRAALALALWEVSAFSCGAAPDPDASTPSLHGCVRTATMPSEEGPYRLTGGPGALPLYWRAGCLLQIGKRGEAETQWGRVDDIRYKDANWLKSQRHWPPRCLLPTVTASQMQLRAANVPGVPLMQSALNCQLLVSSSHSVGHSSSVPLASSWRVYAGCCGEHGVPTCASLACAGY